MRRQELIISQHKELLVKKFYGDSEIIVADKCLDLAHDGSILILKGDTIKIRDQLSGRIVTTNLTANYISILSDNQTIVLEDFS